MTIALLVFSAPAANEAGTGESSAAAPPVVAAIVPPLSPIPLTFKSLDGASAVVSAAPTIYVKVSVFVPVQLAYVANTDEVELSTSCGTPVTETGSEKRT